MTSQELGAGTQKKPLVYIAGPYTNPDPVLNVRQAVAAADKIVDLGAAVVIPHLTMLWHLVSPRPVESWYQIDLDVLAHADIVLRIPGPSIGADREVEYADSLGVPVFFCERLGDWDRLIDAIQSAGR